jgi:hypothetical protein
MELEKLLNVLMVVNLYDANGCSIKSFGLMVLLRDTRLGEGFFITNSPIARLTTIRVLLSLVASHGLLVHQIDVKTIFLNRELVDEINMDQLEMAL